MSVSLELSAIYRRQRRWRRWRVLWRDTRTLWREFRRSILMLFIVTLLGGFIYGERYAHVGLGEIALLERPYIMFQLMILETPHEMPHDAFLLAFWYSLPAALVFIIGNGATDFVRLFFNRDPRRNAWKEALVQTYRQHIIVIGAGHVGFRVIKMLRSLDVDVVAIEPDPHEDVEAALVSWDVPLFRGDGRVPALLNQAQIQHASAILVCTGDDHINLDLTLRVRAMNPTVQIIVRMWNDDYNAQIRDFMRVQHVLSSSAISAPVFAGLALGVEIAQQMDVCGITYVTLKLNVSEQSFLVGLRVGEIQKQHSVDVVLHARGTHSQVQPAHEIVVQAGDTLVLFTEHERGLRIAARNLYGKGA